MVQSSDRIRRWWAVPGSRVRAAGTAGDGGGQENEPREDYGPILRCLPRVRFWLVPRRLRGAENKLAHSGPQLTFCKTER